MVCFNKFAIFSGNFSLFMISSVALSNMITSTLFSWEIYDIRKLVLRMIQLYRLYWSFIFSKFPFELKLSE